MFPTANPQPKKRISQQGPHSTRPPKAKPLPGSPTTPINRPDGPPGGESYFTIQPLQQPMPYSLNTPMSQARFLEDLFTERAYLLNSLQQENFKATDLLRRILSAQANLNPEGLSNVQRKVRKQLGWLKHRLDETNRQEKAILARVGQLTYGIQSIDRWSQVEIERQHQQQLLNTPLPIYPGLQPMSLSLMSLEFQPQDYQLPSPQWSHIEWLQQLYPPGYGEPSFQMPLQEYLSELPTTSRDDEEPVSPMDTEHLDNRVVVATESRKRPPFVTRSSSLNSAELDVLSTSSTLSVPPNQPPKGTAFPRSQSTRRYGNLQLRKLRKLRW
jgi:hypothetical protein